jgi:5-methylcytosine-specific restriction endonuclease McrA
MGNKLESFSIGEIIEILNECASFKEVVERLGYSSNGSGGYTHVKNLLNRRNIEIPKYYIPIEKKLGGHKPEKMPLSKIMVENSTYMSISRLKKRLVDEGIMEYKCTKCGNTGDWMGENLVLQLEHKNGINNDHRKENLEFLCPNCHSQSKTFARRNRKT